MIRLTLLSRRIDIQMLFGAALPIGCCSTDLPKAGICHVVAAPAGSHGGV